MARDGTGGDEERKTALGDAHRRLDRVRRRLQGIEVDLPGGRMSHARFALLDLLAEHEPTAAVCLARVAGFSSATVSRMIDPLVDQGLVRRTRSESDRRVVFLTLTETGLEAVEKRRSFWTKRWNEALDGLDAAQLDAGIEILRRIAAVFDDPLNPVDLS
jgi:MarR family transcriptional regulator, multiple antibiotic resistance protein MarR